MSTSDWSKTWKAVELICHKKKVAFTCWGAGSVQVFVTSWILKAGVAVIVVLPLFDKDIILLNFSHMMVKGSGCGSGGEAISSDRKVPDQGILSLSKILNPEFAPRHSHRCVRWANAHLCCKAFLSGRWKKKRRKKTLQLKNLSIASLNTSNWQSCWEYCTHLNNICLPFICPMNFYVSVAMCFN